MSRFKDFLRELQRREGLRPVTLIRAWTNCERIQIARRIRRAVRRSECVGARIPNFKGTNQSKGNKAATFFLKKTADHLSVGCSMKAALGEGYPDMIFTSGGVAYCMELKATSGWNSHDANRRVLTSSTKKLRNLIKGGMLQKAPAHFLCTVLYEKTTAKVRAVRLDFLEPDTAVNVRLEASTSHKLLESGLHFEDIR